MMMHVGDQSTSKSSPEPKLELSNSMDSASNVRKEGEDGEEGVGNKQQGRLIFMMAS